MKSLRFLIALSTLFLLQPAQALINARVGGGLVSTSNTDDMKALAATGMPKLDSQVGLMADAFVDPPGIPIGLGLRYEKMMSEKTVGGDKAKIDFTRTSLLINKRFIETVLNIGAVATVGLANKLDYTTTTSGTEIKYTAETGFTASIGAEAGVTLGFFYLGAELGYLHAPLGDIKPPAGVTVTPTPKADMSGTYAYVLLGIDL